MKKTILLLLVTLLTAATSWASTFTVTNNGNTFTITRNSSSGSETVFYRTVSLSAIAGVHFTDKTGELTFSNGQTQKTVTITETASGNVVEQYHFQTGRTRTYRLEVLNQSGSRLAYKDRDIDYGTSYQFSTTYLNKSVTDLVYFDNSGNIKSGSNNKYLDVSYSSSNWIKVTDAGYAQGVHTVSTDALYNNNSALRTYLNNRGNKMYATVYFTQKEEDDGYQYIQILADNSTSYDDNDPRGEVNSPSTSIYKACFEMSLTGGYVTDSHHQFFPHRYDFVNKAAEIDAGLTRYSFDYDDSYLYDQKYKSSSYNASTTGSLSLAPTVNELNIRFDAGGNGTDDWYFKDLKVRLALVDATAPTVLDNYKVNGGLHCKGSFIYVSVPFSEIVTVSGTPTLGSTWGTLTYVSGSGSNVLTFSGTISENASGTFSVSDLSGTITDLVGNTFTGGSTVSHNFGTTLDARVYSITYDLAGGYMPTGQSNPDTYTDQTATFTLNNPVREGYHFDGWTGSNGTTPDTTVTITKGSTGNRSYTANWTPINYNITYHYDGGYPPATGNPDSYNIETPTFTLSKPFKYNYDFAGWTGSNGTTPDTTVTIPQGSIGDLEFYANWTYNPRYTYDQQTGALTLLWGEYNKNDRWQTGPVKSVTATSRVSFTGDCTGIFAGESQLQSVDLSNVNTSQMTSAEAMFRYCQQLTQVNLSGWDTDSLTSTLYMFSYCQSLESLDLSSWTLSHATDISGMFHNCGELKSLNLSGWKTDNVTNMFNMFGECKKLTSLNTSGWNTGKVKNMGQMFFNCESLSSLDISHWKTDSVTSFHAIFHNCKSLTSLDVSGWNTKNATGMSYMFDGCESLTTLDLTNWDTDKVTDMYDMFYGCKNLTTIIVGFDWSTYHVQNTNNYMFNGCTSLVGSMGTAYDPDHIGTEYANIDFGEQRPGYFTIPRYMVSDGTLMLLWGDYSSANKWGNDVVPAEIESVTTTFLSEIGYDTDLKINFVGNCSGLFWGFSNCESMDLSNVNTSQMTETNLMFSGCMSLTSLDLSKWNTSHVNMMKEMFVSCSSMNTLDISGWDTHSVIVMDYMFANCSSLNTIFAGTGWSTEAVRSSWDMFSGCFKLKGSMGTTFDPNHTDKEYARIDGGPTAPGYFSTPRYTFDATTGELKLLYGPFNKDNKWADYVVPEKVLSVTATSQVSFTGDCSGLFEDYKYCLSIDLDSVNTSQMTNANSMFGDCWRLESLSISSWDTGNVTDMHYMFGCCDSIKSLDISRWDTHKVTDMSELFDQCKTLKNLDVSRWNTSKVKDMYFMFYGCESLTSLNLSGWKTDSVKHMGSMFDGCYRLRSLNLTGWKTDSVIDMDYMFCNCSALTSLDLSGWKTDSVENMSYMFYGCDSIKSLDLSGWRTSKVYNFMGIFQDCDSLTTIYADEDWSMKSVWWSNNMFKGCTKLVGGMGTVYDPNHTDAEYARIDGGQSNPGYFTAKPTTQRGDVNGDGSVNIADVTSLIDYLLSGTTAPAAADCNQDNSVNIADVTTLIDYLLGGQWP